MSSVVFGKINVGYWKFSLRDVHPREHVVELTGELRAGAFQAGTPMCIGPAVLETFLSELRSLERTLTGAATLQSANQQSEISWTLTALPRGHIESTGRYTKDGNSLAFRFQTDQTQLGPLLRWIQRVLTKYYNANEEQWNNGDDTVVE